jgi:ribosomal silencing factor RsfS
LFELADYGENFILTQRIVSTIQSNEPRAKVMDIITLTTDDYKNSVDVTIIFKVRNTSEVVQLTTNLARLR